VTWSCKTWKTKPLPKCFRSIMLGRSWTAT